MKKNLTELVFILDCSGSMEGLEKDTIGGFNSMINKQKKEPGEALVSTVIFNHESEVVHDRIPLEKVPPMTEKDYVTFGSTALIDAIGGAVRHISNVHKYIREEDVPEKTIFIITTDGMENSSSRFSSKEVKAMIEEKKKIGWDFVFIGANIDSVETAKKIGIDEDNAVNYNSDSEGTMLVYEAVNMNLRHSRNHRGVKSKAWREELDADFEKRGKNKK